MPNHDHFDITVVQNSHNHSQTKGGSLKSPEQCCFEICQWLRRRWSGVWFDCNRFMCEIGKQFRVCL